MGKRRKIENNSVMLSKSLEYTLILANAEFMNFVNKNKLAKMLHFFESDSIITFVANDMDD